MAPLSEILWYEHKTIENACKTDIYFLGGYGSPQYEISDDEQYLLWNDEVRVSMQEMNFLYIVDLQSGRKIRLKKWGFDIPVSGMTWS